MRNTEIDLILTTDIEGFMNKDKNSLKNEESKVQFVSSVLELNEIMINSWINNSKIVNNDDNLEEANLNSHFDKLQDLKTNLDILCHTLEENLSIFHNKLTLGFDLYDECLKNRKTSRIVRNLASLNANTSSYSSIGDKLEDFDTNYKVNVEKDINQVQKFHQNTDNSGEGTLKYGEIKAINESKVEFDFKESSSQIKKSSINHSNTINIRYILRTLLLTLIKVPQLLSQIPSTSTSPSDNTINSTIVSIIIGDYPEELKLVAS